MMAIRQVSILVTQIWMVISWEPQFFLGRPMFGTRNGHEHMRLLLLEKETGKTLMNEFSQNVTTNGPAEKFFTQKLDHFDATNSATWQQRYFYNAQYYSGSNVAFLIIGGEGPESIDWVTNKNYPFVKWAEQFGAMMFSLEHRFYGKSRPTDDQSVKNLHYLNSRQALEDIAFFIKAMNKEHHLENARWITFGGFYSGALSLWARQKYPDLIAGAVGSSAPMNAVVDFWGYLDAVENALRSYSEDCAENVKKAFETFENLMLTREGRDKLDDLFMLKPNFSDRHDTSIGYDDTQFLHMTIFEKFQEAVQYSGVNQGRFVEGFGIPQVCEIMTSGSDPLQQLQDVNEYMSYNGFNYTCNDYGEMIDYLWKKEFSDELEFDSGARSWLWQTCTEFGYYQSTDGGPKGIFGSGTPLTLYLDMCYDVFGDVYNSTFIKTAVHRTQMEYGGSENYKGTNVVIPNGSIDPWHALGKYSSSDPSVVWYLMNGTAHCADMYPPSENDKPDLKTVRALIERNLKKWLESQGKDRNNPQILSWTKPQSRALLKPEERKPIVKKRDDVKISVKTFPKWKHNKRVFMGRPPHGFLPPPDKANNIASYTLTYFSQPYDHFNPETDYFYQQVLINSQWATPNGPQFLKIGGDSPQSKEWVINEDLPYLQWAKKFGATVHSIEHRYYGESIVGGTREDPNPDLTYLSSLQMLYDVADYIRSVNYQSNSTGPWIVFGGSYAGNLAVWARQLFPDLITGAVGSSAPVEAKLDFYEYLEVLEKAVFDYDLWCAFEIYEDIQYLHSLTLSGSGRKNISDAFKLLPPWDENTTVTALDVQFFFSNIYGQYQSAVQYNGVNMGPYADGYGIPQMCKILLSEKRSILKKLATFNEYMLKMYSEEETFNGTENSYSDFISTLKESQRYGPEAGASLLWTWQTCTEFGYFQSTDRGFGMFGSPTPVNLFTRICTDLFGENYTTQAIQNNIDRINHQYGGKDFFKGTNVVLPNGSNDPWHALGLYESNDPSVVPYLIRGTAHCADMYPAREEDPPELRKARMIVEENIAKWLGKSGTTTVSHKTTSSALTTTITSSQSSELILGMAVLMISPAMMLTLW